MFFFGKYIEVTPPSRLVWTNDEGDEDGAVTTVTFEERDGATLVVLRDLYPSKEALDDAIASGSTSGWASSSSSWTSLSSLCPLTSAYRENDKIPPMANQTGLSVTDRLESNARRDLPTGHIRISNRCASRRANDPDSDIQDLFAAFRNRPLIQVLTFGSTWRVAGRSVLVSMGVSCRRKTDQQ